MKNGLILLGIFFLIACANRNPYHQTVVIHQQGVKKASSSNHAKKDNNPSHKGTKPFKATFEMNSQIDILGRYIRIKVYSSNLKKGTVLTIQSRGKKVGQTKVKKDGSFHFAFLNPGYSPNHGGKVLILMLPWQQSQKLVSFYGKHGGNLKGKYAFSYKRKGTRYHLMMTGSKIHIQKGMDPQFFMMKSNQLNVKPSDLYFLKK